MKFEPRIDILVTDWECADCRKPLPRGTFFWSRPFAPNPCISQPVCNECAAPVLLAKWDASQQPP